MVFLKRLKSVYVIFKCNGGAGKFSRVTNKGIRIYVLIQMVLELLYVISKEIEVCIVISKVI